MLVTASRKRSDFASRAKALPPSKVLMDEDWALLNFAMVIHPVFDVLPRPDRLRYWVRLRAFRRQGVPDSNRCPYQEVTAACAPGGVHRMLVGDRERLSNIAVMITPCFRDHCMSPTRC